MSSSSFLACCDFPETCPSNRWPEFEFDRHTIGERVYSVPLLWLALFRRTDLRVSAVVDDNGNTWTDISPIAPVNRARQQLTDAIPTLNHLLANHGSLDEYVELLNRILENAPGEFVSIELLDLAAVGGISDFARQLKQTMLVLSQRIDEIRRYEPAPLKVMNAPEAPSGLRGKAAVAYLVDQTKREKREVERILENCRGNVQKALEFFRWQTQDTAYRQEPNTNQDSAWATMTNLSDFNLYRPFPRVEDALNGRLTDREDWRNFASLVGDIEFDRWLR